VNKLELCLILGRSCCDGHEIISPKGCEERLKELVCR
jgi:hypothetical protein